MATEDFEALTYLVLPKVVWVSSKIAFVTPYYDPRDIRRGSGTFYYMSRELERQGCQVVYFGPIQAEEPFSTRLLRFITKKILHKRYLTYLDPAMAKSLGVELQRQLDHVAVDLVLTNDPGVVAGLCTDVPVVYYSDVMLPASPKAAHLREVVAYRLVPTWALRRYQKTIRQCLERAALSVFPAQWQKEYALGFGVSPTKVKLLSFGANIDDPGRSAVDQRILNISRGISTVKLLFVGRDWLAKGGDVALKTVELLRKAGVNAQLTVVGTTLPDRPAYVQVYGKLNKAKKQDANRLDELFRESYSLIFPSLHEGSAISPREAAAYGVPTLAYRIEGLTNSVIEDASGVLLEVGAEPQGFADIIQKFLADPKSYSQLCLTTRKTFEANYDWRVSIANLRMLFEDVLNAKSEAL